LDRWLRPALQGPVFAGLMLVVAAQSVWLYTTGAHDHYSAVRGGSVAISSVNKAQTATLKVNFKDETPEQALRFLLISIGANITQGPGQLGDYDLIVPAHRLPQAMHELGNSKWVNMVIKTGEQP
jgi:hypothetical protein